MNGRHYIWVAAFWWHRQAKLPMEKWFFRYIDGVWLKCKINSRQSVVAHSSARRANHLSPNSRIECWQWTHIPTTFPYNWVLWIENLVRNYMAKNCLNNIYDEFVNSSMDYSVTPFNYKLRITHFISNNNIVIVPHSHTKILSKNQIVTVYRERESQLVCLYIQPLCSILTCMNECNPLKMEKICCASNLLLCLMAGWRWIPNKYTVYPTMRILYDDKSFQVRRQKCKRTLNETRRRKKKRRHCHRR